MVLVLTLIVMVLVIAWLSNLSARAEKRDGIAGPGRGDEIFDGVAPGIIPADPDNAPVRRAGRGDEDVPIAVRFEAPQDVVPEEAGVLAYRGTSGRDIAAAFVSMSIDGWYRIEQDGPGADGQAGAPAGQAAPPASADASRPAWRLVQHPGRDPQELDPLRRGLYEAIFAGGPVVSLEEAKSVMAAPARAMRRGIDEGAIDKGWYRVDGGQVTRTAVGSALHAQAVGFREYLGRAESRQIRFEEAAGIFSRFLPWAVALGVADKWAEHFAGIAEEVTDPDILDLWAADLLWWAGMDAILGGALTGGLGEAIGALGEGIGDIAGDIADFGGDLFSGDLGFGDADGGFFDGLFGGDGGGDGGFFDGLFD